MPLYLSFVSLLRPNKRETTIEVTINARTAHQKPDETKLKYKGINCKITCYKCDYGEMEILEYIEGGVLARCKRCGDSRPYYYKNE